MCLSIIIPTYNEEDSIISTIVAFHGALVIEGIDHEILVIDDGHDHTEDLIRQAGIVNVKYLRNPTSRGFGSAIKFGLAKFSGDCVAIVMADMSDSPSDLIAYYTAMQQGYDCVFGSRFIRGGKVVDYPLYKLVLNRITNTIISLLFGIRYNDTTNAFKLYRREAIDGLQPLLSPHFNITVELPLKAIVRRYSYTVVPNSWINRKTGESKLHIKEMGSRYFFIILYCLLEKWLSRGDYHKLQKKI